MNRFIVFTLRIILGAVFAVILSRFFHPEMNLLYGVGLWVFLVGMAYLFEYLRKRKNEAGNM